MDNSINCSMISNDIQRCDSNDVQNPISSRETAYIRFISTLPRLCSPTICGTTNYKTPKASKWSSMAPLDQSVDTYKPFEWSIDQKALLDPCDISIAEDMDLFKRIDERISNDLDKENDLFFAQKLIIPSPKTPEKGVDNRSESSDILNTSGQSFGTNWSQTDKTPEYQTNSRDNVSTNRFKTPLNCLKSRQKKKLFEGEDQCLTESIVNRSPKDSAFDTIDSQNLLSPIYSPDWRNTSLSKRITHLSPICSHNQNHIDLDIDFEVSCLNDESMRTQRTSYSNLTCDMLSIDSELVSPKHSLNSNDNVFREYNRCQQKGFQRFMTKTSTPSHL